jgi:hypothetical protein
MATQTLLGMFEWKCMARKDVEIALGKKDDSGKPLDFICRFDAAMEILKTKYAPSGQSDANTIRLKMARLNDQGPDGFRGLQREYIQCRNELDNIKPGLVSPLEEREWLFRAIQNVQVSDNVTVQMYNEKPEFTADEMFEKVNTWLTTMALLDRDPYKKATTNTSVSANRAETSKYAKKSTSSNRSYLRCCTRCWGSDGHTWRDCRATSCSACAKALNPGEKTCPEWKKHSEPYRFKGDTLPWERSFSENGKRRYEGNDNSAGQDKKPRAEVPDEIKEMRKALKAAIKKFKKAENSNTD